MAIVSKTRKISQETCGRPYVYDVHMEGGGGVLKFVTCLQFFLNNRSIVHFCRCRELGVTQLVIFCGHHKCVATKWFKTTANSVIRGSSSFLNIKPDTF